MYPWSTFKLIDALIAQQDGLISRSTVFPCHGEFVLQWETSKMSPPTHQLIYLDLLLLVTLIILCFREIVDQKNIQN